MPKKSDRKPPPPNRDKKKATSRIVVEARVRIVERCMSIGTYDAESIHRELKAQNHDVSIQSVYAYIRKVRARISEESSDLRSLRKAILIRDTQRYERVIFGKLMDADIKPLWKDLVGILKIRERVEAGRYDELVNAPLVKMPEDDLEEISGKTSQELDEMIQQMIAKTQNHGQPVIVSTDKESLH